MSEPTTTPENSGPETGPVLTPPPAPVTGPAAAVAEPPRPVYIQESSRLNKAAAWVGIVAGVVFIVAVIFGSGFIVGKHSGNNGWRGHDRGHEMMQRPGPAMFPMGPRGDFERGPGFAGPFGPGGPMIEMPRGPGGSAGPGNADTTTPTPPRP